MAQLTVKKTAETPSERIIRDSNTSTVVKDSTGRSLEVKKLSTLDRMRMSKAAGAENASNQPYMLYALVAYSVTAIDGAPMVTPQNELHLETAIAKLGDEGYAAALDAVLGFYGARDEDEVTEAVKK